MGFISGTTTITVQAKLTNAGKKKLYDSIENSFLDQITLSDIGAFATTAQNGPPGFITKFALGDSDSNYAAIDAGSGVLDGGHVPEAGEFMPSIRSYAIYKGLYRPGVPVVLVEGQYGSDNGITKTLSIGGLNTSPNSQIYHMFDVKTEWPKDELFTEDYKIEVINPGNMTQSTLNRLFSAVYNGSVGKYSFVVNGPWSLGDFQTVMRTYGSGGGTVVPVKLTGNITNAHIMYNILLTQ